MNLLSCAELLEFKVLTHRYQQHQQDLLPFSHPLAWEEMRLIKSPPTPFFLLFCTFFGGRFLEFVPRGAAVGRSWAALTSCLGGTELLLAQGAAQSPSLEAPQCRKPAQKKGAASTQKGKVICPSRRLEQNLEQSSFACQRNPLTFNNNAATLSWRPLFISSVYKWLSMKDFLPRGSK